MTLRPLIAVTVCVGLAVAGVATAAPKKAAPVCNLIADAKGDDGSEVFQHSESLDIVGADIASTAKLVTSVIRVAKYSATDSSAAPTGRAWYLEFSVPDAETPLFLGTQVTPGGGTRFNYGWVDGTTRRTLGTAEGVIDEAKSELRVTVPVGIWAETGPSATIPTKGGTVKPGFKVSGLSAASYNYVGVTTPTGNGGGSLQPGDTAEGKTAYTAGAPSCVAVGKQQRHTRPGGPVLLAEGGAVRCPHLPQPVQQETGRRRRAPEARGARRGTRGGRRTVVPGT